MKCVRVRCDWQARFRAVVVGATIGLTVAILPADPVLPQDTQPQASPDATPESPKLMCASGRLTVADLALADQVWAIAIDADSGLATEWREDAVLVGADVTCGFLNPEIRVRTMFYSASARSTYEPESGEGTLLDPGAPDPRVIRATDVSFEILADVLEVAGYDGSSEIGPAGITVRLNSESELFGPPTIPLEATVLHVTMGSGLDARDLFVTTSGELYRHGETEDETIDD